MKEEEKKRIGELLHRDKTVISDAVEAAAVRDFARVAGEYFELDGGITFSMREEKGASCVSISFRVTRVKNFTTLP